MAKTKADYVAEGKAVATTGGYEVHYYSRDSTSWQSKAFWEGYDEGKREYAAQGVAIAADIESEGEARRSKPEPVKSTKADIPAPVLSHYNFLMRTAATCSDPARALRLRNKASHLRLKWSSRVMARA